MTIGSPELIILAPLVGGVVVGLVFAVRTLTIRR